MTNSLPSLTIIGGGLAGCEAAWQAAQSGIRVELYEMRQSPPMYTTGAHRTDALAELVCSNSLGSNLPERAAGLLKQELRQLGSLLMHCADQAAVPSGTALSVDRQEFSQLVTQAIESHPNIRVIRQLIAHIPSTPTIIATGPLTHPALISDIQQYTQTENLFFFDAIAPIVTADSICMDIAYRASRYDRREFEGDYINCPLNAAEYETFVNALCNAERIPLHAFEQQIESGVRAGSGQFFEGCLPIEVLAQRDPQALAFGPLRPVGLWNPHTRKRPHAVLQLRQDNQNGTQYNLVGCQTNLTIPEQQRVFRLVPGLQNAEFVRYGQMHRNTYIAAPNLLSPTLQFRTRPDLFFAGQIAGVEGYVGSIATGFLAGWNAARLLLGKTPLQFPPETMLGALCHAITHTPNETFQPIKANFGLLPMLESTPRSKTERSQAYTQRALTSLHSFLSKLDETP